MDGHPALLFEPARVREHPVRDREADHEVAEEQRDEESEEAAPDHEQPRGRIVEGEKHEHKLSPR